MVHLRIGIIPIMANLLYQDKQRIEAALNGLSSVYDCGFVRGMLTVYYDFGYFSENEELFRQYESRLVIFEQRQVFKALEGLYGFLSSNGSAKGGYTDVPF